MVTIKGDAVANKGGCSVGEGARPTPMKATPPKHSLAMDEVGEEGNEEEEEKEGREDEEE